jgi:hypothetical protein
VGSASLIPRTAPPPGGFMLKPPADTSGPGRMFPSQSGSGWKPRGFGGDDREEKSAEKDKGAEHEEGSSENTAG